jgi:hypothetical protein
MTPPHRSPAKIYPLTDAIRNGLAFSVFIEGVPFVHRGMHSSMLALNP